MKHLTYTDKRLNALLDAFDQAEVSMLDLRGTARVEHYIRATERLLEHPDYVHALESDGRRAAIPGSVFAKAHDMTACDEVLREIQIALAERRDNGQGMKYAADLEKLSARICAEINDYQNKRAALVEDLSGDVQKLFEQE